MKHLDIYTRVRIHQIMIALVLIGAFNWGSSLLGFNLVEILNNQIDMLLKMKTNINILIYVLVTVSALILAFKKSFWLPFLGYSAFPTKAFVANKINYGATMNIKIKTKPNTRIAYWASLPKSNSSIPYVEDAYGNFSNSGVVMSNDNGDAVLSIKPSTSYIIPSGAEIPRHIHYRLLDLKLGMMSDIKTVYY